MIKQLELRSDNGAQLFLFEIQTDGNSDYLAANSYISPRNFPVGTIFSFKNRRATYRYQIKESVKAGLYTYPGDDTHFGRLPEPLLLLQIDEVTHGD